MTPHKSLRVWEGQGQDSRAPTTNPQPPDASGDLASDKASEDPMSRCFTKRSFSAFMQWSERTTDRLIASGAMPRPDCWINDRPRWLPSTIERWLKSKPKLRGRGRHG
jgi:hypothetical protein